MKIAALQLATLPMSKAKLDYYLRICRKKEIEIVVLGEYVLNSFFKELKKMPLSMIQEQSNHKIEALKELSKEYNIIIAAPIITVKKDNIYKKIGKFSPKSVKYYTQEFLINYKHWNEENYFDNGISTGKLKPLIFTHRNLKFGVMGGFDIHFDPMWIQMQSSDVDVVLVPTASTFDSNYRWNKILKSRAFINSVYILRVNRIGGYEDKKSYWKFYGDTFLINPDGYIESSLGNQEEMLIADIDKDEIKNARKSWGFKTHLQKRKLI